MTMAVRVDNLGKRYRVAAAGRGQRFRYRTLREDLTALAAYPWRRWRKDTPVRERDDDFWALRDVGFEVKAGEVLGIIGRNGAGKSTLLKVLSRITRPTVGRVDLWGRVGSLLEVGTGFHPELTGRENIFINGAILGMRRREIARKFDEIVAFAEVERFLDTPVKRYSSGMYVRLAFAVAAHLQPEILIVDEVLAVGDLAFQEKCMGRMREAGRDGRTVLFISHNMAAIESLCDRALLLDAGRVIADGAVADLVAAYRRQAMPGGDGVVTLRGRPVLRSAALLAGDGEPTGFLPPGGDFHLRIGLESPAPIAFPTVTVVINDLSGHCLLTLQTPLSRPAFTELAGPCEVDCRVAAFPLAPGEYWASLALSASCGEIDAAEGALGFRVVDGDAFGEGRGHRRGLCIAPSAWSLTRGRSPAVCTPTP